MGIFIIYDILFWLYVYISEKFCSLFLHTKKTQHLILGVLDIPCSNKLLGSKGYHLKYYLNVEYLQKLQTVIYSFYKTSSYGCCLCFINEEIGVWDRLEMSAILWYPFY